MLNVIRIDTGAKTRRDWDFYMWLDAGSRFTIRLARYTESAKTGSQRKWRTTGVYDTYDKRNNSITSVAIPDDVALEVKNQIKTLIDKTELSG